jgi:hypothetical protein
MTITQLEDELEKNGMNTKACLINPEVCPEGALCLIKERDKDFWTVIKNERGEYLINEKFYSENDACRFFFRKVISDPTYHTDFKQDDLIDFPKRKAELLKKYGYIS